MTKRSRRCGQMTVITPFKTGKVLQLNSLGMLCGDYES